MTTESDTMAMPAKTPWKKAVRRPAFTLYRHGADPFLWQIRSRGCGSYVRRQVEARSLEEAVARAEAAMNGNALSTPPLPTRRAAIREGTPVSAAFEAALADTRRREGSRSYWLFHAEAFVAWLAAHHPQCSTWEEITRPVVREWVKSLAGKAPNTIRLYTQPLRQTSAFMAREHGLQDVAKGLGVETRLATLPPIVHLLDVAAFVRWSMENCPWVAAGIALQGLAGLQLQEALRLT